MIEQIFQGIILLGVISNIIVALIVKNDLKSLRAFAMAIFLMLVFIAMEIVKL